MGWIGNQERANFCFFPLSQEILSDLKGPGHNGFMVVFAIVDGQLYEFQIPFGYRLYIFSGYAKNQHPSYVSATMSLKNSLCTSVNI